MAGPRITLPVKWRQAKSRRCWRRHWRSRDQTLPMEMESRASPPGQRDASGKGGTPVAPSPHEILRNIFANVVVARRHELLSVTIEDDFPIAQDQEAHRHFATLAFG